MLFTGREDQFYCLLFLLAAPDITVVNSINDVCLYKKEKPPDDFRGQSFIYILVIPVLQSDNFETPPLVPNHLLP